MNNYDRTFDIKRRIMKKFRIFKTSDYWDGHDKPHNRAYIDKTETIFDDEVRTFWAIDVSSLEELLSIVEDVGNCIVLSGARDYTDNLPSIEIYDDYRE